MEKDSQARNAHPTDEGSQMTNSRFEKSFDAYEIEPVPCNFGATALVLSPKRADGRSVLMCICQMYVNEGPIGAHSAILNDCLDLFSLFDHPSLPSILDRGTFQGYPSFIVPYYKIIPIRHVINYNNIILPLEAVKHIMLCTMDALDHFYTRLPSHQSCDVLRLLLRQNIDKLRWRNLEFSDIQADINGHIFLDYPDPLSIFEETYRNDTLYSV